MAVRADVISNRRHSGRALQAVGLVALLGLAVGLVLTASSAFGGGLAAKPVQSAGAHMLINTTDTPTPAPTSTPGCRLWNIVNSPNVGGATNELRAIGVVSADDIWAAGDYIETVTPHAYQTLVEHWDGTQWSIVPSPNAGAGDNSLSGIAVVSPTDVWAAGFHTYQTLIEHWDGTAWSVVPSPSVGTASSRLLGVAAVSAHDVWAVGYDGGSVAQTLIEHWDGAAWSVVPSPNPSVDTNELNAIAVVSANDVWAVGFEDDNAVIRTLVEHWDGTAWSVVPSANMGPATNYLQAVAVVSANNVWAVGYYAGTGGAGWQTLVEHWDGTAWSVVPSPNAGTSNFLFGVAAVAANDVWAVGCYGQNICNNSTTHTLVEHWNGIAWTVVPSANSNGSSNFLTGVGVVSAGDLWAVGYGGTQTFQTLVERYHDPCPTATATATSTPTFTPTPTVTDTPTGTPPTSTPTSTPCSGCTAIILGHLTWQSVSPSRRPLVTGTLELCVSGSPQSFNFTTDTNGSFTLTAMLPDGTYHWRVKGGRHVSNSSPANGPNLVISGGQATQEFGLQRGGNANFDNIVNTTDFGFLKSEFGRGGILPADYTYDQVVNASDFNIQKTTFGLAGNNLTCP